MNASDLQRFLAKVEQTDGCWLWNGARSGSREGEEGYGVIRMNGHHAAAHRVSYEHFVGPVPEGLVLDHTCDNRRCVNPAHLVATTHRENILRGKGATASHAAKERCPEGHLYDTLRERRGGIERSCSICNRRHWRDSKRRRRAVAGAA